MQRIFALTLGVIIGALAVLFAWGQQKQKAAALKQKSNNLLSRPQSRRKEQAKQKILALFQQQDQITNNDVENLLGVSDATATNYLDELEQEGLLIQKGKTGRNVFYTLKRPR